MQTNAIVVYSMITTVRVELLEYIVSLGIFSVKKRKSSL